MTEILVEIYDEVEIDGETVSAEIGQIVRGNSTISDYSVIKQQYEDRAYIWNAPQEDWNADVELDDPRWELE